MNLQICSCTICRSEKHDGQSWFLLGCNQWEDRLQVFEWHDELAAADGMYAACSPDHVQELAAHWLANGTLNYPFTRPKSGNIAKPDATSLCLQPAKRLGELAVHRESLNRAWAENPGSLVAVLDALAAMLPNDQHKETVFPEILETEESMMLCRG
jgi:hypothetical protein